MMVFSRRYVFSGVLPLVFMLGLFLMTGAGSARAQARIEGRVVEAGSEEPLIGANVRLVGTSRGAATDADGRFVIGNLEAGTYALEAMMIGFEPAHAENVVVAESGTATVTLRLAETVMPLREVVVTPGRFAVMQAQPVVAQTLSRSDIQALPQLGEDIYRAARRLPGLAGNDYSSQINVRGGLPDELLVELDGMELYEPFHMKDIGGGALSVLDAEAIGGIDMMTGAFPAEYGDRMSGVFSIASATPARQRTSVGISFMNMRFLSEGRFAEGNGEWLVLARRGYLDLVMRLAGGSDEFSPTYYDVLGKVKYRLTPNHSLALHVLHADDALDFSEDEDVFTSGYGNSYGWVTWDAVLSPRLLVRTLASVGRVTSAREGFDISDRFGVTLFELQDERRFTFAGIKQDWTFDAAANHFLKGGVEVKGVQASYDYFNQDLVELTVNGEDDVTPTYATTRSDLDPDGLELGAYVSHRMRLTPPLTVEWGVRYDRMSWTDDDLLSPRLNVAYALSKKTTLRGGWGHFYQAQGIHKLDVQDGDERFYGAERAEHRMVGITHAVTPTVHVRVEAYQKKLTDVRPRYVSLDNDQTEFFPEAQSSNARVRLAPARADAHGVEVFARHDGSGRFNALASYSYAVVEDHIDGKDYPRSFDQRHTLFADVGYQPSEKWRVSLAWQYHSGWPYTEQRFRTVELEHGGIGVQSYYGEYHSSRFPAFHRMDVRVSRYFDFTRSRLTLFAEVSNLYDRQNPRLYYYDVSLSPQGNLHVDRGIDEWLPLLPSIGASWDLFK